MLGCRWHPVNSVSGEGKDMVSETRPPLGNRVGEGSSLLCFGGCHLSDFLNFLGILYPPILAVWEETGVFQQPRLISSVEIKSEAKDGLVGTLSRFQPKELDRGHRRC
jgi:hypothetical protein